MEAIMNELKQAEWQNFDRPDEVREFPFGRVELVKVSGATIGRGFFDPGWRWSTSVKPIANTHSCQAPHFQYQLQGVLHVVMDDGTEFDLHAGDVTMIPPGHDAWVVGDEQVVVIDFQGMVDYAKHM